jgi:hypothetical protein
MLGRWSDDQSPCNIGRTVITRPGKFSSWFAVLTSTIHHIGIQRGFLIPSPLNCSKQAKSMVATIARSFAG